MEKIKLNPYEVAAYYFINLIIYKTREIAISGPKNSEEKNFYEIFKDFGDLGYRKLFVELSDCIKEDVVIINTKTNNYINYYIQSTSIAGHDKLNTEISIILDTNIPDVKLSSNNYEDFDLYVNDEEALVSYGNSILNKLSTEYESNYILSGDIEDLYFDRTLLSTLFMLSKIDPSFDSIKDLRIGFCKEYNDDNNGKYDIKELHDKFNHFFDNAATKGIVSGSSQGDSYGAYFYESDYAGLDNYVDTGLKYAEKIIDRNKLLKLKK
jgi:hypothetical protein